MIRRVASTASPSVACAVIVLALSSTAHAEPIMQPSAQGMLVVADREVAGGAAGTLLVGYNTENDPILIVPHVAGSFGYYGGAFSGIFARALGGMKFGAALSVEPSLITRGGYGHYQLGLAGAETGVHGLAFQSGPALDYRISRTASVGGELLYDLFIDPASGTITHAVLLGLTFGFGL